MRSSGDKASRNCFSAILSRLLCSGSLPAQTHPSEQLTESSIEKVGDRKPEKCRKPENEIKEVGVVARLMGLESFPSSPKDRTLGDFFRSKSVNSIDFLSHFDPMKTGSHRHRRVRTSVSFREGINNDFPSIILRLDDEQEEEEEEEVVLRRKNREYFQGRKVSNRPGKNLEMEEKRKPGPGKISPGPGPRNSAYQKKDLQGKTRVNLKERRPIIKTEKCMEELLVSKCVKKKKNKILAHQVHCKNKIHPEGTAPEIGRGLSPSKCPQARTVNCESPNSRTANSAKVDVRAINRGENDLRKIKIKENCYYKRMVEEICMVTEEDVRENWNHLMMLKFEDIEEICQQFGQEILEVLLKQLAHELVLFYCV